MNNERISNPAMLCKVYFLLVFNSINATPRGPKEEVCKRVHMMTQVFNVYLQFDIHFHPSWLCSIIFDRLAKHGKTYLEATTKHLNEYGENGLRTLALSYRKLDEQEYEAWNNEFQKAKLSVGPDRAAVLEQLAETMEKELILVGATAVEDKLQKGVNLIILCNPYLCVAILLFLDHFFSFFSFFFFFSSGAPMH